MLDILIKDTLILSMEKEQDGSLKKPFAGDIAISGDRIAQIGKDLPLAAKRVVSGKNQLAMPGLVNLHTHTPMSLLRSYGDDLALHDWLHHKVFPAEERMQEKDAYWGSLLAIWEMIKSGTTCFADMYFYMEAVAEAVSESGVRASLARGITGDWAGENRFLTENIALYEHWHNACDGRIKVMLGPHAVYTCSKQLLKEVARQAERLDMSIHIHLAETQKEVADCEQENGQTPAAYLAALGLFEQPALAAHAVWLTPADMDLLAAKRVTVAHCPRSNLKLASGMAKATELRQKGVGVGFGTDGACSNNDLNLFLEMRQGSLLAKGRLLDPTVMPAAQALTMASYDAARYLGFADAGCLKENALADLILLDLQEPHFYPPYDLLSHLVYSAAGSDVLTSIVNGRVLMENKELLTIDTERIRYECGERYPRLLL